MISVRIYFLSKCIRSKVVVDGGAVSGTACHANDPNLGPHLALCLLENGKRDQIGLRLYLTFSSLDTTPTSLLLYYKLVNQMNNSM
jgi:hypothetical protein